MELTTLHDITHCYFANFVHRLFTIQGGGSWISEIQEGPSQRRVGIKGFENSGGDDLKGGRKNSGGVSTLDEAMPMVIKLTILPLIPSF